MKSIPSVGIRVLAAAPVALAATWCLASPAGAVPQGTTTITWQCQGTVFGVDQTSTLTAQVAGDAPTSAAGGSAVTIKLTPLATAVPASSNGFNVNNIHDLQVITPYPAGATFVSATASGGSVAATIDTSGGKIALNVAGPIAGGASFTLPAETINVTAGASGSITSTYAGTSYADAGMTLTSNVDTVLGPLDVPISCYPDPKPTFTTTTIGGAAAPGVAQPPKTN
ncbi:hypothetical protein [Nocardia panacis]|nr:hypothetical protein [Nocardia panacis]